MSKTDLLLRTTSNPPLTTKGSAILMTEYDATLIALYNILVELSQSSYVDAYSAGTTYDDTVINYALYSNQIWKCIAASPIIAITPVEGASWTAKYATDLVGKKLGEAYLEVNVSAAQIRAIGTTPIQLLPTLAAGKYYDFKIITEYDYGTAAYNNGGTNYLVLSDNVSQVLSPLLNLNGITGNRVNISTHNSNNFEVLISSIIPANGVFLTTGAAGNPTVGDGTIKAKIWYTIRTFG